MPETNVPKTYIVKKGDTLGGIALKYGLNWRDLQRINAIPNDGRIRVGQTLKLTAPTPPAMPAPPPIAPKPSVAPPPIVAPAPKPVAAAAPVFVPPPLGDLSKEFESGSKGPATVSKGVGDHGGVSYGSYQLSSNMGVPQQFVASEGKRWAAEFGSTVPGTAAFSAIWESIGKREPREFHDAQHAFIKRTHYDRAITYVFNESGTDLSTHSHALQDVIWSTAVQHGGEHPMIMRARQRFPEKPSDKGFDKALISGIYDERGMKLPDGRLRYFQSSAPDWQKNIAARFEKERRMAQAMLERELAFSSGPRVAPTSASPLAPAPTPPKPAAAVIMGPNKDINAQLPLSETGFVTYNPDNAEGTDRYGLPRFVQQLINLGAAWKIESSVPVSFGDMSHPGGSAFPPHVGHQTGNEVDIRPFRKDGANLPMRWDNDGYDQARTRQFLTLLHKRHGAVVVLFNDPKLIAEGLCRFHTGHSDHIHIRIPQ